ncbi:adenylyltransferase/cytidyltransferase family protein [Diplocloster agilis]|uniref:Adenylyltransferase/cytidyltransferase family protein n=1 Tax=Diplocloster agilis TaxID=2850323 RepID=A0A949JWT9_9FIRM|nr:adenylyltransferase/cytidyltransferase family protein [Diplocloster agilis]MBU9735536.1 adenylyltransferase/cytidyltransferase family protein [Diplocloster agilis]
MKKYKVGYTQGVYDMFHVGHLNLLQNAKEYCDYLIVGVNTDSLVQDYKKKSPVVSEQDRLTIVSNIRCVDKAILTATLDKIKIHKEIDFDVIFIGDDWKGNPRWETTKIELKKIGVDLVFLPYTQGVSSTLMRCQEKDAVYE